MVSSFFSNMLDVLIRSLDWNVRIIISFVLFMCAIFCMILSIRKKNDSAPLSLGWFILTFILIFFGVLYITL